MSVSIPGNSRSKSRVGTERRRGRRFSLRQKINLAILLTFVLIVVAFAVVQLPLQQQRLDSTIGKVQLLLQTLVERDQEPLANEIFEDQQRAIELRLRQMLSVQGIIAVGLYDVDRRLLVYDSASPTGRRSPPLLLTNPSTPERPSLQIVELNGQLTLIFSQQLRLIGDPIAYIQLWYSLAEVEAEQQTSLLMFVSLLTMVLVLMLGLLNTLLSKAIVRPIQQLGLAIEQVQSGTLGSQVDVRGSDEISQLTRAFNRMSLELAKNRERQEQWNQQLQVKVDERTVDLTRLNQELLLAKQAAEQASAEAAAASQAKSQFLANMSHEIRTPMNAIIGFSYLGLQANPPPQHRDYFQKISLASKGLLGVINDILDFSRIEADKMQLESVSFSLTDVLQNLQNLFGDLVRQKQIGFSITIHGNIPPLLYGDPLRLQQVLTNLLGNAVKFTESGAVAVQVEVLAHEPSRDAPTELQRYQFTVRDTGIGMTSQTLAALFNAFTQADSSTSRKFGGTGLGLTISQRLVRLMGGDIQVKSQPGCGSEFSFCIPLAAVSRTSVSTSPSVAAAVLPAVPQPAVAAVGQLDAFDGWQVLVVDDSQLNQQVARELLQQLGVQVTLAGSASQALNLARQQTFHLALLDLELPDQDGYSLAAQISQLDSACQLPLVAMSAHSADECRQHCLHAGFVDFISKPVEPAQFYQVIQRVLTAEAA